MATRRIRDERELATLARLAAPLQERPETHVIYVGTDADTILAELRETTWQEVGVVAVDGDETIGWLVGDVDPDMGRVWWHGPFVAAAAWDAVASELLEAGRRELPGQVAQEELAVDARFERCRSWAGVEGFVQEEGSFVLDLVGPIDPPTASVREITTDDHEVVIGLHEALFPGTHTTGATLVAGHDETHRRLVIESGGAVVGYVAVERQPDGSGYIDFLGVAPSARRKGLGGELVRAGVAELRRMGAATIGLTVREGSTGARDLYVSLGFREERVAVPLRRGFSLA
jgi:ribosomal protein S18 acetylase RimI-like enzyme